MSAAAPSRLVIPDFLTHLPVFNGLPVPFTQAIIDGAPDFRATDFLKVKLCAEEKLCAICGHRLGDYACFIGGPLSRENHLFSDPAMHPKCAEFAARICPFVSGRTSGYSARSIDNTKLAVATNVSAIRPRVMYVLKTRTKHIHLVKAGHGFAVQAGPWIGEQVVG
ncbi:MAG TPA: hypothetical protein VNV41_16300 [Candidatus Acidoferrales bacterium]|nr:hypothetical protein [Candidatus Acidoferrales bacterium]